MERGCLGLRRERLPRTRDSSPLMLTLPATQIGRDPFVSLQIASLKKKKKIPYVSSGRGESFRVTIHAGSTKAAEVGRVGVGGVKCHLASPCGLGSDLGRKTGPSGVQKSREMGEEPGR